MTILRTGVLVAALGLMAASALPAWATTYSDIVVYGDSLSDNGNLYALDGNTIPAAPYYQGRFSNGPVAVEQLAASLGVPLFDFAYGGATSGYGNAADGGTQTTTGSEGLPGMFLEVAASASKIPSALIPTSLFVVWGGANDYEAGGSAPVAAADIDAIVVQLENEGAKNILVPGLPDLGLTPEFYQSAAATAYSVQFNQLLQAHLPPGATYFDTYSFLNALVSNYSHYGFTNVTGSCYPGDYLTPLTNPALKACSNPNQYLFWDDIHPTTAADALLSQAFLAAVNPAAVTPEPGSLVLLGTGVIGMAGVIRRRLAS